MSATMDFAGTLGQGPASPTADGSRRRPAVGHVTMPAAVPASLYDVLHVKETASAGEIKAAYRALAKRSHPDVAGRSTADDGCLGFVEIHRAYATLSDPAARQQYDRSVGRVSLGLAGDGSLRRRRWETDQC